MRTESKFLLLSLCLLTAYSCKDDDEPAVSNADKLSIVGLQNMSNAVTLDLQDLPDTLVFDRVKMDITGVNWSVIRTVEAPLVDKQIILNLPTDFDAAQLQVVDRRNTPGGYWPIYANDANALVATIPDLYLYNGTRKVARLRLSNWKGSGSSAGKATLYLQYADRPFTLSGRNNSYSYQECTFVTGWNAFANVNSTMQDDDPSSGITCTTVIPNDIGCYVTEVR
jgi:hypothetical protein